MRGTVEQRIAAKVDRSRGPDACWPWTGFRDREGYGYIKIGGTKGKLVRAHRLAYELARGPIPEGLWILHACDNRPCCNPAHLRTGTNAENVLDKVERGRAPRGDESSSRRHPECLVRGTLSPWAKLDDNKVSVDGETQRKIAARFGVSRQVIAGVLAGRRWAHVVGADAASLPPGAPR